MTALDAIALFEPFNLGRGVTERFAIGNPGAGNPATRTTGNGYMERVRSLSCQLATSAAVANRQVQLRVQDADANVYGLFAANVVQVASTTIRYGFAPGVTGTNPANGVVATVPISELVLLPAHAISIVVSAIDAADAITSIFGLVERFPIGWTGYPLEDPGAEMQRGRGGRLAGSTV